MLATIKQADKGYEATFERSFNEQVGQVWTTLTDNAHLKKWMSNLEVILLQKGGTIQFHFNDGTGSSFAMNILDYEEESCLQFDWGEGFVRFELNEAGKGSCLRLIEYFPSLNDHTPKDLAGWHVCLDLFAAVLKGGAKDFSKEEWNAWYEQYATLMQAVKNNEEQ